ncbi:Hg(II)-responsive transcriptional regulator [Vibrio lentus]|jgi:MerR family mercuric resistance operon transcriptional regulator|uniref:Hg(II)-responsive transcriptional regulator n=1 Tax=Vibrio lentus TaxID=136468 RepID=UPI000C854A60|nr:Hg(II)-responsive transcriptional regulator [Vibrio lentus]MCC4819453.1 Hg(II)-responsive transcriptional regulator [Vibrio lentus]PMG72232.1 Hg(II)-responsive transcriptional regulator [Vibrio lentus]PMK91958.1 Hg(II)-responsive transcriptional regulator [Vibrio lentus]PML23928.1 Hg(II)-responsive transcriptional regulator [Vibrio lentus]PMM22692.1 Hg(II)-responsive transcriptional regulator [Vibrio lentus]
MKISELAKSAGVNVETIRYYERRELIQQPLKPEQGFRDYTDATLERVLFIKRAQELGFTLEEISNLLQLGDENCLSVQEIAEHKLVNVRAKIVDLCRLESVLDNLVTQCKCNPSESSCPIVETLLPKNKK